MKQLAMMALAVLLALCVPRSVCADAAAEARFHDSLGRDAYERRRFEDALAHFLDAHAAAPSPTSAYNIALAADLAGHAVLAFHFFEEYLAHPSHDEARRAEAVRRRDRLAARLALVRIDTDPPGATIQVDRAELGDWGTTPRTIAVSPGARHIVLTLPDHREAAVDVEAAVGELRRVRATLPRRTGTLVVDADAAEAEVVVSRDGEVIATGPAAAPLVVPVGSCVVRIEPPGRRAIRRRVVVRADTVTRVVLHAPPLPVPRGRLLVRATEGTARVRVDGELRGTTPLVLTEAAVGTHTVEVEADGHVRWRGDVSVREGRSTYLNVTLTRAR